jgi:3-oxoacyl-[acyl-carrier-protein] synthase-1
VNTLAVVLGVGARTSVGLTARHTAFLLRAGSVGLHASPLLDLDDELVTIGSVPILDPIAVGADRVRALAIAAADEALEELADVANVAADLRLQIVLGLPERFARHEPGQMSAADVIGLAVRDQVKRRFAHAQVETVPRGEAAAPLRLEAACEELAAGRVDLVLLGGAHTDYEPMIVRGLAQQGRLFVAGQVNGVLPGECAGFLLLATPHLASRLRKPIRARLHAVGKGFEKARADNDEPAFEALGLTVAVHTAAAPLKDENLRAGWALTDMSAEVHRIHEWQAMFTRTQRYWCEPQSIEAHAHKLGRLGAAAMPVQIAIAATAWRHGFAPHPIAISTVGSEGGDRAATLWSGG